MKMSLTKGLEKEAVKQVEYEYHASKFLRQRLTELLERQIDILHSQMRDDEEFENPSWGVKQASKIGQVKAHKKLIELISD